MAQKTICDICGKDITPANRNDGLTYNGIFFKVATMPDAGDAFDADICHHCIIDAFVASDDRGKDTPVKKAHPLANLSWMVIPERGSLPDAAFSTETRAKDYAREYTHAVEVERVL
jgi:hypothetical protein